MCCAHLKKQFALVLGEIFGQYVPQPANHSMRVMETPVILCMLAQIPQIQWHRVARDETLQFGRREQREPLGIDNAAKATIKRLRLLANLCVHMEICHVMYVHELVMIVDHTRLAARMQFVCNNLAHDILIHRESQVQIGHILFVVLDER